MSKFKHYLFSIILSVIALIATPVFLFAIFLSGDSCCGEDRSGVMIGFTLAILAGFWIIAALMNWLYKQLFKRNNTEWKFKTAFWITTIPASSIYLLVLIFIISTAGK
ncbi:hypothetical protein [Xanthocytophaga flava]|uniref:hypothetical protein n=1 Tax=Xanthocytophaga flava TaxID=3048013 RepID=UPI0028D1952A|nr:hypothetical protein [Xanthocytophaga flavus]MDJ1468578.1 hypothetical protein [Xanthocytophaga flavus]